MRKGGRQLVFSNKRPAAMTARFQARRAPGGRGGGGEAGDRIVESLDMDGLPPIGLHVTEGDALYCVVDATTGRAKIGRHKDSEPAYVEEVRLLGVDNSRTTELTKISIKLRYNRNPVVGDKFSSRHGQKGVLSTLFPQVVRTTRERGSRGSLLCGAALSLHVLLLCDPLSSGYAILGGRPQS